MASPSSSSLPHGEQPRPYEVFISFRGEDTRNGFVSHLYSALKGKGIRAYFDEDNLQEGQTIGLQLMKAIQESSIAIVVLTQNYGSSSWCLTELVRILECRKTFGLVVFPIFYNVDPSDVRKHKVNLNENDKMGEIWKKALEEVAGIKGKDIRGKNETSSIKKIVDKLMKQLPVKALEFEKSLVGIESRISEIKKMMDRKFDEVLFIGLWGMGGIGKTTTARAIFEDCKNKFEGSCFLQDVKESKNKLHILQQDLLYDVLKIRFDEIRDVVKGSSMIQERLRFKKVLIVIDDVDDIEQLNALANRRDWFGKGSRIVITTRDQHLIDDFHIEKYCVKVLLDSEALNLFCLHAFKNDHPFEDYKTLSHKVLSYVGGLPLALRVLGNHLYRREKDVWESTLNRLKDVPEDKIISTLQISFEGLSVLQQNIFLDIACLFRGFDKDNVEEKLAALGLHPKEGIDVLIQKSLIYITSRGGHYIIEMHDLLQEMGRNIVRKRANGDIRRYSRLWLNHDILEVLSDITVSSEAERVCTDLYSTVDHFYELDDYDCNEDNNGDDAIYLKLGWDLTFKIMNKLSFLQLSGDFFNGNYNARVSQPFDDIGNKLRWFSWGAYPATSLPITFRPINLVQLHMESSRMHKTPDFSYMPYLEVVDLSYSSMLLHVHPSLGNLRKIKRVNLAFCSGLKAFPKIHHMQLLELLDLSHTELESFPEIYSNLDSLRKLDLSETSIRDVPTSIPGTAIALQTLSFRCLCRNEKEFRSLEVTEKSFPGLVALEITFSGILRTLDFSDLPYLEKLDLSHSTELMQVHASLGVHKRIKSINLSNCVKLEEFPTIVGMKSLEKLILSNTKLQTFPEICGKVDSLREIDLREAEIKTLPWSVGRATNLEVLNIGDCEHLVTLPIIIMGFRLQLIDISSRSFKYFEENIHYEVASRQSNSPKVLTGSKCTEQLPRLKISFRFCESLEELPEYLLSRIEIIVIEECSALTGWICVNLEELLDKYQNFIGLELHLPEADPHLVLRPFSDWESTSNMLWKREKSFKVYIPRRQIPSWLQYQFRRRSVTVFLPPSLEWDTDNLRGFVISSVNADFRSNSNYHHVFGPYYGGCDCHVLVMYIPIDGIRRDIDDWNGQDECTLLELNSSIHLCWDTSPTWGLSLIYSGGEVNEVDPHQLILYTEDDPYSWDGTFRVKLAGNRDRMEKLNMDDKYKREGPISWASLQQRDQ